MTQPSKLIQCYNKGCSQLYDPDQNHEDSCTFHPKNPFFHDAYKGWACCNKKCTDFTEFLNIKGCTTSFHNNTKPVTDDTKTKTNDVIQCRSLPKTNERLLPRPNEDAQMVKLPASTATSLERYLQDLELDPANPEPNDALMAAACRNGGCGQTNENGDGDAELCVYHPGIPVFHEGLKFWSCCLKKTSDFNSFLEQLGCASGKHVWGSGEAAGEKNWRYDWYETGGDVFFSLYAKGVLPDRCLIRANSVKLKVCVECVGGFVYENEFVLNGIVDVGNSGVVLTAKKVEVRLKKAEAVCWQKLTR